MLAAAEWDELARSVSEVFAHLKGIKRIEYPLSRAIELVLVISRGLAQQIRATLAQKRVMFLDFESFRKATDGCDKVLDKWKDEFERFREDARELKTYRISKTEFAIKHIELEALQRRLDDIRKARKLHEELRDCVTDTFAGDAVVRNQCLRDIDAAYELLRGSADHADILDVSLSGEELWKTTLSAYQTKIHGVEAELEERVRQMLSAAKNDPAEMFRVCAKFNALFVRPNIQAAIRDYQETLISTVKIGIVQLEQKFNQKYEASHACKMSTMRDVPLVSGSIIWARQIERHLDIYLQRVEDVLGKRWSHHVEGQRLKTETDQFRARLQPTAIFQTWLADAQKLGDFEIEGRVFKIVTTKKSVELHVNFDRQMVTLYVVSSFPGVAVPGRCYFLHL